MFLNEVKHTLTFFLKSEGSKSVHSFFFGFIGCWAISNFVTFHNIKVAKDIWDPCCHLATKNRSWCILIAVMEPHIFWSLVCYRGHYWKGYKISYTINITRSETRNFDLLFCPTIKCYIYFIKMKSLSSLLFPSIFIW